MNKHTLIKVLAYDRFHRAGLTVWDRIMIHQYIHQHVPMHWRLREKVDSILGMIKHYSWDIPKFRYNAAREIEVYDPDTEKWNVFQKPK